MARVVGVQAPGSRRGAQSCDAVDAGSSHSGSIPLIVVVVVPLARDDHHTSHAISCTAQIGQLLSLLALEESPRQASRVCGQDWGR
jgi:hypothetical protein